MIMLRSTAGTHPCVCACRLGSNCYCGVVSSAIQPFPLSVLQALSAPCPTCKSRQRERAQCFGANLIQPGYPLVPYKGERLLLPVTSLLRLSVQKHAQSQWGLVCAGEDRLARAWASVEACVLVASRVAGKECFVPESNCSFRSKYNFATS